MKEYVMCNFSVTGKDLVQYFTNNVFKNIAYNAKLNNKLTGICEFKYVAIPKESVDVNEIDESVVNFIKEHNATSREIDDNLLLEGYSIYKIFSEYMNKLNSNFSFDILFDVNSEKFDIFYSDGSSSSKTTNASYGMVKLLEESYDPESIYDDVTKTTHNIEKFSGIIADGTNNIGELSGVSAAVENAGGNRIQVIVSDSEYSLKCFREWIWTWKNNGYKGSNKKTILNCELIQSIQDKIEKSDKIYLFKWTKGHADTELNEICDDLAKKELGI